MTQSLPTPPGGQPSSARTAGLAVAILFFANTTGYLDRNILTLLVGPVKASLGLSDGEIGLMLGLAFVVTFSIAGLFIGSLVDRTNRRNVLIVCVAIWSISAAASGLAQNGWQLFVTRMGVGMGEAALLPAAVSLISDYYSPEKRGRPYGVFTMGVYAGSGLSLVFVGAALPFVTRWSQSLATGGLAIEPWRLLMFAMLIPGLAACLFLAKLKEPARTVGPEVQLGVKLSGAAAWLAQSRILTPHHMFMAATTLALYAFSAWAPTLLIREHGQDARSAGLAFGLTLAITGIVSALVGGVLADRASRRWGTRGRVFLAMGCLAVGLAGFLLLLFAQDARSVLVATVVIFAPLSIVIVAGVLMISDVIPGPGRGQVTSIYFAVTGLVGYAGGPMAIGYLNDAIGGPGTPLSSILAWVGIGAITVALIAAFFTDKALVGGRRSSIEPEY